MIMDETSASALSNDASAPWRREPEMRWKRREMKRGMEKKKEEVKEMDSTKMKLERHSAERTWNIKGQGKTGTSGHPRLCQLKLAVYKAVKTS